MGRVDTKIKLQNWTSVIEVPDSLSNVVGQIPLEDLDLVVDCRRHRLIPNPEHKDGVMYDDF